MAGLENVRRCDQIEASSSPDLGLNQLASSAVRGSPCSYFKGREGCHLISTTTRRFRISIGGVMCTIRVPRVPGCAKQTRSPFLTLVVPGLRRFLPWHPVKPNDPSK